MTTDLDIPFDRVTYRDGQLLAARDLRNDQQRDARLRHLHTRYLHETWGIALGFSVTTSTRNPTTAVVVAPGYAVDISGRDILLAEGIEMPVPRTTDQESFVLVVSYQEDAAFRARNDLKGVCLSGGLDPRNERPLFAWKRPAEVRFGPQVPLVQVVVANNVIQGGLDFRVRRHARPFVRPHMASGTTEAGQTGWKSWVAKDATGKQIVLGLEVMVNTAEAGFTKTPLYFPTLIGSLPVPPLTPLAQIHLDFVDENPFLEAPPAFFQHRLCFITQTGVESFTFRIVQTSGVDLSPETAEEQGWTVSWLGVEPVTGCEPALDLGRIFSLSGYLV